MELILTIKPLSVNKVWQGRRFKTTTYTDYEKDVLALLPSRKKIPEGNLQISIVWGFSNAASDFDNPTKPFLDILQKKYGFNDKVIHFATIGKVAVPKGKEFIWCNIEPLGKDKQEFLHYIRTICTEEVE